MVPEFTGWILESRGRHSIVEVQDGAAMNRRQFLAGSAAIAEIAGRDAGSGEHDHRCQCGEQNNPGP
jgi:hypothetical protein